jgi:hypothetical protein
MGVGTGIYKTCITQVIEWRDKRNKAYWLAHLFVEILIVDIAHKII